MRDLAGNTSEWVITTVTPSADYTWSSCASSPCYALVGGTIYDDVPGSLRPALRYAYGWQSVPYAGFRCVSAPLPATSPAPIESTATAPLSCEGYAAKSGGGTGSIGCNTNTADGYYWAIGSYVRAYGYNGMVACGSPRCDATTVGATAEIGAWQASTTWGEVADRWVYGGPGTKCPTTDGQGGSYDCSGSPHCGIFQVTCAQQP